MSDEGYRGWQTLRKVFRTARQRKTAVVLASSIHFVVMALCFVLLWETGYKQTLVGWYPYMGDRAIVAGYVVLLVVLFKMYHALYVGRSRITELFVSQALSYILAAIVFYIVYFFYYRNWFNPLPIMAIVLLQTVESGFWCYFITKVYFGLFDPAKTVVFYSQDGQLEKLHLLQHFFVHYNVTKAICMKDVDYDWSRIDEDTAGAEVVFCCSNSHHFREKVFCRCMEKGIKCYYTPDISDLLFDNTDFDTYFNVPVFSINAGRGSNIYLAVKRGIDILLSLAGILILSPLMLVVALVIRLSDGGPALYKQVRLTKYGKEFNIYKFRSMVINAENDGVARLSYENDDRITPVGKFLRRFRLDELPQLFNILKGDMSLVGPRPERPEIAEEYAKVYPAFPLRLKAKAGLTGFAQVYGQYNTEPEDKLKMDLIYINHISLKTDILLLFMTVKAVFKRDSTKAVSGTETTALSASENTDEDIGDHPGL